jgi:hypothetical protein
MDNKDRMALILIRSSFERISELLTMIDRGFGENNWERINSMEEMINLVWKSLSKEYQILQPTLKEALNQNTNLHIVWGSCLDEVNEILIK